MRPYAGDADLPRVVDLLLACRAAGTADMEFRSTSLRMLLRNPTFDAAELTLLVDAADGTLDAFAVLWQGAYLGLLVHPRRRGALEAEILAWARERVRSHAALAGDRPRLFVLCRSDDLATRALLERDGFALHDAELRMIRPLDEPVQEAVVPDGFAIRSLDAEREMEDWIALSHEAFGARDGPDTRWRGLRRDVDYLPELDLVAVDRDGALCGFCTCTIPRAEAEREVVKQGGTEPIMVRERYRGIGLGRALVLTGLHLLRAHGMHLAALTTEQDNVRAHRFYKSLGYQHVYDGCWYVSGL